MLPLQQGLELERNKENIEHQEEIKSVSSTLPYANNKLPSLKIDIPSPYVEKTIVDSENENVSSNPSPNISINENSIPF